MKHRIHLERTAPIAVGFDVLTFDDVHVCQWGVVAAVAAVASVAISTYSAVQQSEFQAEMANAQKKQSELNANAARDAAAFEETQQRRRNLLVQGKQQAIFAAAGLDSTSGTPFLDQVDLVQQGELEALRIRAQGAQVANAHIFEGRIAKFKRDTARAAIPLQIAGGVASAASSGVGSYYAATPKTVAGTWTMPSRN